MLLQLFIYMVNTTCLLPIPTVQPNDSVTLLSIEELIDQLPTPFAIVGDFKAHNLYWHDTTTNKGHLIPDIVLRHHLVILNDESPTHYLEQTGTSPRIVDGR